MSLIPGKIPRFDDVPATEGSFVGREAENRAGRRTVIFRWTVILLLVLVITALHYLTATNRVQFHDVYRRLYYIPIVLGGLWFSLRGGMGTAILVTVLFIPHVLYQWDRLPTTHPEQYLEVLLYNGIGFLTGFLSQREKIQKLRQQQAALRIKESYAKLKKQADTILEIEEQLRRADRLSALGELSAGLAHEIRNPLGSIRGTAEILQEGIDPADRRHEFSRILIREVDRLNQVVRNFLDFARPSADGRGALAVDEALREVEILTHQQARKNEVEVRLEAEDLPGIFAHPGQLKQAFLNLVLNALQAMPDGGTLTISGRVEEQTLCIRFADTGQGIPSERLAQVFDPFFTTRPDGTGLGLAITERIVRAHGGRIEVASEEGVGTTFTVRFPLQGKATDV
jgi:two-component system sensor histidine kinase HydH